MQKKWFGSKLLLQEAGSFKTFIVHYIFFQHFFYFVVLDMKQTTFNSVSGLEQSQDLCQ